jgi:thiol-disulfide isomerase/thioredoxin
MTKGIVSLALALLLSGVSVMGAESGIKVGDVAPPVDGKAWVSKDGKAPDFKGKVHVVEFWFAACGPCNIAAPHLAEIARKYADKGLVVVSPTPMDGESKVKEFKKKHSIGDEISYLAEARTAARAYGGTAYPTAFLVDKEGKVLYAGHPMNQEFEKAVSAAMK